MFAHTRGVKRVDACALMLCMCMCSYERLQVCMLVTSLTEKILCKLQKLFVAVDA